MILVSRTYEQRVMNVFDCMYMYMNGYKILMIIPSPRETWENQSLSVADSQQYQTIN